VKEDCEWVATSNRRLAASAPDDGH
jgi:hypothetical protein